ncbi:GTP-binding protein [Streptomyces sp. NPDC048362]|uniref:GTP-binding protein n=1 Tax=Streptomyces sp. NPDC048362 TaxID=3365539 RepID=UPI00371C2C76
MHLLNLGILAHVDAGKTSLTTTDTLALERRRGITIKSAVVSFPLGALAVPLVPMGRPAALGTRAARFLPGLGPQALDTLADQDDELLAAYLDGGVPHDRLHASLAARTRQGSVQPVYFGSAVTGAGLPELTEGIERLLPTADGDPDGPLSATVFKIERGPAGEKVAYARLFSGTLRIRDRVPFGTGPAEHPTGDGRTARRTPEDGPEERRTTDGRAPEPVGGHREEGRVTALTVFDRVLDERRESAGPGRIVKVWGLGGIRVGDALGLPATPRGHHFAPPTLETVVVPGPGTDRRSLHLALGRLAEQDPLIDVRHDERRRETSVSLYGEVQKEVIQATLADEYGLDVTFRETTTLCVERPAGTGHAVEFNKKDPNPFLATVGLRVDPAPAGSGVGFRLEVELGSMPYAFFKAVEDTVRETLGQGLYGWRVTDCTVTMTHAGYSPRQSHAHQRFDKSMSSTGHDFRGLTPLVLVEALRRAGSLVHEPLHRFRLQAPADTLGALLPVLARLGAVPETTATHAAHGVLEGIVPAARVHELGQRLPGLTRGEGELETAFDHYAPITRGTPPRRPRTDHNPLNRKEYLLNVTRRAGD